MARSAVERGWLGLEDAGRYVGVNPDVVRRAVAAGDLPAYAKPATYREGRVYMKIAVADLDSWVRSWPRVVLGPSGAEAVPSR